MVQVKIKMNNKQIILAKRKLQKNGPAHEFFTKECEKIFNPYVPWLTGNLKDVEVEIGIDYVKYKAPYAKKQFYTNQGKGKQGTSRGGLRGKRWDKRSWNDKGTEVLVKTAKYIGGKADDN